jgi:hypothetical protein
MKGDFSPEVGSAHAGTFLGADGTRRRKFGGDAPSRPTHPLPRAGGQSGAAGKEFDGKIGATMARFPGPVTLCVSRFKFLGLLAASLGFVAALIYLLQHGGLSPGGAFKAWLGIAFFGAGALVAAVMVLPGAGSLTLGADGFERITLFMKFRTPWRQVSDFVVAEVATRGRRMQFVSYDDANCTGHSMNRRLTGRNSALPDSYGLSHQDLALLMNRWRARALAQRVA